MAAFQDRQPLCAGGCSSVLVGRDASVTGRVLLGHNEDDSDVVSLQHYVPRMRHEPGETISFEDGTAVVPQVAETCAYYWSEMRSCSKMVSFGDSFVNEWGVAVVSNLCSPCRGQGDESRLHGLGYGLRRLVAERARSAREGVEIAIALVGQYGYAGAHAYQICDKNEAWSLQLVYGTQYAAMRIPDDEVLFIPNWYTIHQIDFGDVLHDRFYFSADLTEYAASKGWYRPARPGDLSDFDFAASYQEERAPYNVRRARGGWRILFGEQSSATCLSSAKLDRRIGLPEIKKVLRCHFEGTADDASNGFVRNPHADDAHYFAICNGLTAESSIIDFGETPAETCIWRAELNPCISPYVPWYLGAAGEPDGYGWYDAVTAQKTHFRPDPSDGRWNPRRAFWAFKTLRYLTDFNYRDTHETLAESAGKLEEQWQTVQPEIIAEYRRRVASGGQQSGTEYLTACTAENAETAWRWAEDSILSLGEARMKMNGLAYGQMSPNG